MKHPVYLICGVPGSGKTWVCEKLKDKFYYIPHDQHFTDHAKAVIREIEHILKPIITECPFGERLLREELEKAGIRVIPYFVIDSPRLCESRYKEREKKPYPKNFLTRASTIRSRAIEWRAPMGTSGQVLALLENLPDNNP